MPLPQATDYIVNITLPSRIFRSRCKIARQSSLVGLLEHYRNHVFLLVYLAKVRRPAFCKAGRHLLSILCSGRAHGNRTASGSFPLKRALIPEPMRQNLRSRAVRCGHGSRTWHGQAAGTPARAPFHTGLSTPSATSRAVVRRRPPPARIPIRGRPPPHKAARTILPASPGATPVPERGRRPTHPIAPWIE